MKLQFDHLAISGFKSFKNSQMFDLTAYAPGLHFIRGKNLHEPRLGPNGVGKSALWDALVWALYGRTVRGLRNPDIRPWTGSSETCVTVWLTIDKVQHQIDRTAHPNQLRLDDVSVGQDQIESLIGLTKEVFCHTVLLGQGEPLFLDLNPKEKMQVFTDVLQLERWEQRAKAASNKASDVISKHDDMNGRIAGIKSAITQLTNLITETRTKSEQWMKEQQGDEKKQRKELTALQKHLAGEQKLIDDADLAYDGAGTEVKALDRSIEKIRNSLITAGKEENRLQTDANAAVKEKSNLQQEKKALASAKNCPICGQPIKNLQHLKTRQLELDAKISALTKKEMRLIAQGTAVGQQVENLEGQLGASLQHLRKFEEKAETAESALYIHRSAANALTVKIAVIEKSLSVNQDQNNPHLEQVKNLIRKKNGLKGEVAELEELRNKLSRRYERVKFWIKGFKEVQLYIVDEVLQELELVSNTMLTEMGLEDWSMKYAVEKETQAGTVQRGLNVTVLSPNNDKAVRWESWSGGEGQRLRVIGALALSEVLLNHAGVTPNIEVLDEPTRGLSDEGVNDLCAYLSVRAEQLNKQCWLIDHAAIPSTHFTSTLTIVRDKKGSRLVKMS